MSRSFIVKMPDFSQLHISEKQKTIHVRDEQIFHEVKMQNRRMEDRRGGATAGDYVLVTATRADGMHRKLHIALGGKAFPAYEQALLGCEAGQVLNVNIHGKETVLSVQSVRKIVEFPLTDESVAGLNIPGVSSLVDYRKKYLQEHGEEIFDKMFRALQKKLMEQIAALTEFCLDEEEVEVYHKRQCAMLQNISGDVDARILKAYGGDGTSTLQECYQRFYEDNKYSFSMQLWGKTLAQRDGVEATEEEYNQALEFYCLAFDTTPEQVEKDGFREEVLRSFYMQYGIKALREYCRENTNFSAEEIPVHPRNG